jgi:hypothetical protein
LFKLTLKEFAEKTAGEFAVVTMTGNSGRELSKVFCCDLLSFAMARNPEGSVWVTVMGNINTIAVASLTNGGVVILAENSQLDENAAARAEKEGVTVMKTALPVFEAALKAYNVIT